MKTFLLGLLFPLLALEAAALLIKPEDPWYQYQLYRTSSSSTEQAVLIVGLPFLGAAIGAQLMLLMSPRRLFDRRATDGMGRRLAGGFVGGLITTVVIGVLLIVADQYIPDVYLVGAAGFISGAFAILPFARVRQGACFHCGYDLTASPAPGQPGFGRCPECGADCMETPVRRRRASAASEPAAAAQPEAVAT